jgi:hypothetical protein
MHPGYRICLLVVSLLLAACTPASQVKPAVAFVPESAALDAEQPDRYWWQLRFRFVWSQDEPPDFSAHLLVAEQLLLPVLIEQQSDLPLWRLHRRAGPGDSGNQFSLIFYADTTTATRINEEVSSAPLTLWLLENKLIDKVRFAQRSPEELGRLELTSDPEWPIEIQRSWPYYAMGASQAWLMLVQALSQEDAPTGEVDYPALLLHYQTVDARLNAQWRSYGQHAYLHHLSAIFGYQPLQIRSNELRTF